MKAIAGVTLLSLDAASDSTRRGSPRGYLLLNVGGWLLFGFGMTLVAAEVQPWEVVLATTPVYFLMGFLLSLLLGLVYDRLGVGPASFGRALVIIVVSSIVAAVLWNIAFVLYQAAASTISVRAGGPAQIAGFPKGFQRDWWAFDFGVINSLPMFASSLVRLGLQYNTALHEQREQTLLAAAAARDAQLRMLAYQLNPHFLFNTLNSIRALVNEDGQRARDMVTALSGYLRYALVERPLHMALLEEEMTSVRGYLAIEQVRFEERLDVQMDIEPAALRCEVPAFLLNPLVENAVKHGAPGTPSAPLVVRIEARLVQPDRLMIIVENTGVWKGTTKPAPATVDGADVPGGVGLANVRARLKALHPGDHRVEMDHGSGRVRFLVELPARLRAETAP